MPCSFRRGEWTAAGLMRRGAWYASRPHCFGVTRSWLLPATSSPAQWSPSFVGAMSRNLSDGIAAARSAAPFLSYVAGVLDVGQDNAVYVAYNRLVHGLSWRNSGMRLNFLAWEAHTEPRDVKAASPTRR